MKIKLSSLINALELKAICNVPDVVIDCPVTDSRMHVDPQNALFFALTTSCNDGHRYIRDLYRRGVRNFAVTGEIFDETLLHNDCNYIIADDSRSVLDILQLSAQYVRSLVKCPIIAITGSRGKTVVKQMIADSLPDVKITTSPRSWNSQIGVPLSVWRLSENTQLGVFEAGISQYGEMDRLREIICPEIGIFTELTDEHSHNFRSLEDKCREKCRLFINCKTIIYLTGNPIVEKCIAEIAGDKKVIRARDYNEIVTTIRRITDLSTEKVEIPHYEIVSTRIDISDGQDGNTFAYDYYSNDLDGIETALDIMTRRNAAGRPLTLVIGNIASRGEKLSTVYDKFEKILLRHGIDRIVGIGDEISSRITAFSQAIKCESARDVDDFITRFNCCDFPDSVILIKGEPGKGYERIKSWLEDSRHETSLEVNLDSLVNNFNYFRSLVKPTTGMVAMVKADAYGTGAVEVSRTLQSQGADYLAVAVVEEGLTLRRAGISMPVMVLNPITSNYTALFDRHLEPTVFSLRELITLSKHVPENISQPYPIHIKLDTGMHRFGLSEEELGVFMDELKKYPQFRVASVFSHLATADCPSMNDYTLFQLKNFDRMSSYILSRLDYPVKRHILNTAGIMRYPEYQYDMVRLGIGLYGISPLDERNESLTPVATLSTTISALQDRKPGETVGYARRGIIENNAWIATIPIGYADGLNRHLGNGHTFMRVNGKDCPTIGNICMDISMIDVTGCNAREGDRVEIFGRNIPIEKIAETLDTIPYEVLTSISPRVKRTYYRE